MKIKIKQDFRGLPGGKVLKRGQVIEGKLEDFPIILQQIIQNEKFVDVLEQ
jgi:hypothetical protein